MFPPFLNSERQLEEVISSPSLTNLIRNLFPVCLAFSFQADRNLAAFSLSFTFSNIRLNSSLRRYNVRSSEHRSNISCRWRSSSGERSDRFLTRIQRLPFNQYTFDFFITITLNSLAYLSQTSVQLLHYVESVHYNPCMRNLGANCLMVGTPHVNRRKADCLSLLFS